MDTTGSKGVTADGIAWRLGDPSPDEVELVAKIKAGLHLLSDADISSEWARRAAHRPGAGRQRVYRPCPVCGEHHSARQLRTHLPGCKKPRS